MNSGITGFDMDNQNIQKAIAHNLKEIGKSLDKLIPLLERLVDAKEKEVY